MSPFEEATRVEPRGDGLFDAVVTPDWWVVRGPHGGYLTAMILRALTSAIDDPARSIRSFTTHFVAAPEAGPVQIATTIERNGRSFSYATARLLQDGDVMATSQAAFSIPWTGVDDFDHAPAPKVAPPDECIEVPKEGPMLPSFVKNFDTRWGIGDVPFSGSENTVVGGWLRLVDSGPVDAPAMACMLDAWAPAILPRAKQPTVAPTIDITMHFRAPLPLAHASHDDYFLFRLTSRLSRDGFFEEDGDMWGPDGRLVAQCRQLAISLPVKGG